MTLKEKLDALKAQSARKMPPEAAAVARRATEELVRSGIVDRAKKVGERAPGFELPDAKGELVRSRDLLAQGPLVLTFYRGNWCPYCTTELEALQEALDEIRTLGASLVAVSPQTEKRNESIERQASLGFPVLSDRGNRAAAEYGLVYAMPADLKAVYEGFGIRLPLYNGDDSWTLPIPARFVIGADGVIRYAAASPDYTVRPEPAETLAVLRTLADEA